MDLQSTIMEEVILKNYKLLQYVENEMNQLKDEMNLLKKENAHFKKEMNQIKDDNIKLIEENKMNKNLFCNIQNIQDTVKNTMIIGYDIEYMPISWNIDKALLIPSFKESTDLPYAKKVANFINSQHKEIIISENDALNAIDEVIYATCSYDITTIRASCGQFLLSKYIKVLTNKLNWKIKYRRN